MRQNVNFLERESKGEMELKRKHKLSELNEAKRAKVRRYEQIKAASHWELYRQDLDLLIMNPISNKSSTSSIVLAQPTRAVGEIPSFNSTFKGIYNFDLFNLLRD